MTYTTLESKSVTQQIGFTSSAAVTGASASLTTASGMVTGSWSRQQIVPRQHMVMYTFYFCSCTVYTKDKPIHPKQILKMCPSDYVVYIPLGFPLIGQEHPGVHKTKSRTR